MAIVYMHTNRTSGKSYIGQTVKTLEGRWAEHCSDAIRNKKRKFFRAINKYGTDDWDHKILFESTCPDEISDCEIKLIEKYDTVKKGYNTSKDRFRTGTYHKPESIEKMKKSQREAHARRRADGTEGGWKRKDGGAMKGKPHPNKGSTNANKGKRRVYREDGTWYMSSGVL